MRRRAFDFLDIKEELILRENFSTAGSIRRAAGAALAATVLTLGFSACDQTGSVGQASLGPSCSGSDLCLGIRYVTYKVDGDPIVDEASAVENIDATNQMWKQCGIQFQIDSYEAVQASDYGLASSGGTVPNQTSKIRSTFDDGRSLLVVQTGDWGTTKNAWTAMPGSDSYGAVFEAAVADYPQIMAHELGHYLGLSHVSNTSNTMNAVIYPHSEDLSASQCESARETIQDYWKGMLR